MKLKHACLVCGVPFGTRSGLCPYCAPRLFGLREPSARSERGLKIHSLFKWRRDGWPAFRSVVARLKGQEEAEPWLELAAWFLQVRTLRVQSSVIVPVPSAGQNHALGWARALTHWTGWPVADRLSKTSARANKELGRFERSKLRFDLKTGRGPGPVDYTNYKGVIIVDDIVTTGATAWAAYRALGRPRNCEVWCLMDRRPWQGEGPLL